MSRTLRSIGIVYLTCVICKICGAYLPESRFKHREEKNVLHCYCNLAYCISSNYMCKIESSGSGCYKKYDTESNEMLYGCLNAANVSSICFNVKNDYEMNSNTTTCCFSPMCNEFDQEKIQTKIVEREQEAEPYVLLNNNFEKPTRNYYTNAEIWFRALLIAVPFCGLIVFVLIVQCGLKILRSQAAKKSFKTSQLLNNSYKVKTPKNMMETEEEIGFKSHLLPQCNNSDKNISIVFKPHENNLSRSGKYLHFSEHQDRSNISEPKVHKNFSKQNFNILNLPYKYNELNLIDSIEKKSINVNNKVTLC